jgi:hypothetical protein
MPKLCSRRSSIGGAQNSCSTTACGAAGLRDGVPCRSSWEACANGRPFVNGTSLEPSSTIGEGAARPTPKQVRIPRRISELRDGRPKVRRAGRPHGHMPLRLPSRQSWLMVHGCFVRAASAISQSSRRRREPRVSRGLRPRRGPWRAPSRRTRGCRYVNV